MVRRTKAEAEATRVSLLDAAERLFHERGVSRTSLQDIAAAAGVTRGAVYWHFKDKGDLFNALMERARLPMEEPPAPANATAAALPAPADQLLAALAAQLERTLAKIASDTHVQRVVEIAMHKVELVDEMATVRERHRSAMEEHRAAIDRCLQRAGHSPERAAEEALGLNALVAGLIQHWMLAPGSFDLPAGGRRAIDTYLRGLTADPAATPGPGRAAAGPAAEIRT